ncbi:hypothetical protein [Plantactinospora sp. BB1]|uniref:hypothetical protein n=1 Tax=Plantactinospora sp. BB1 TaxID=2071627 RepID=UPI00131EF9D7|nr:hypothetical protein [Plantactinospora sp. BB1]
MEVDSPDWQRSDQRIFEAHADGGRCAECAPRGGCMVLLAAVRRRVDSGTAGTRSGLVRLC